MGRTLHQNTRSRIGTQAVRAFEVKRDRLAGRCRGTPCWLAATGALLLSGVSLPIIMLARHLGAPDMWQVGARGGAISSDDGRARIVVRDADIRQATWLALRSAGLPRARSLPGERQPLGTAYSIRQRGPMPHQVRLEMQVDPGQDPDLIDALGWDGQSWQWLGRSIPGVGRVHIELRWLPRIVTLAVVSAKAPALRLRLRAPGELPGALMPLLDGVDVEGYLLQADGSIARPAGSLPDHIPVISNLEDGVVRQDVLNNVLAAPAVRQTHARAIVELVRLGGFGGAVLDYAAMREDRRPDLPALVELLSPQMRRLRGRVWVAVPLPVDTSIGYDGGAYDWLALGKTAGLRVVVPAERASQDGLMRLARWAVGVTDRTQLQLEISLMGRDTVDSSSQPIAFGDGLSRLLELAEASVPAYASPGQQFTVDLPALREAGFERDAGSGMYRFRHADHSGREHTVWLTDASILAAALNVARRYGLGGVVLRDVTADADPRLASVLGRARYGGVLAVQSGEFRVHWRVEDYDGRLVAEQVRLMARPEYTLTIPERWGDYRVRAELISLDGTTLSAGSDVRFRVGPTYTPTPTSTPVIMTVTPAAVVTVPIVRRPGPRGRVGPTPGPEAQPGPRGVVSRERLAVRRGPHASHEAVGELAGEDWVAVLGRTADGRWLLVQGLGLRGWVAASGLIVSVPAEWLPVEWSGSEVARPTPE